MPLLDNHPFGEMRSYLKQLEVFVCEDGFDKVSSNSNTQID